jgi:acyl-CoA reductase-like NAD-dependent aldehyde dehydrogenase
MTPHKLSAIRRKAAKARWKGSTPEQRSASASHAATARMAALTPDQRVELAEWIAAQGAGRPRSEAKRCKCGADTVARATRRANKQGTCPPGDGHGAGCPFYRENFIVV